MDEARFLKPNFPMDAFATTVEDYVRYRLPYPAALVRDLLARTGATGSGQLLDLACGPGRASLPLAGSFKEIWAIDLEPRMVEAGRRLASERGIANVRWLTGRAEDLEAPPGYFDLITIGEAFHRLDQKLIAEKCLYWLSPGGFLATIGSYTLLGGGAPWQRVIAEVVKKWTGFDSPAITPSQPEKNSGPRHDELALLAFRALPTSPATHSSRPSAGTSNRSSASCFQPRSARARCWAQTRTRSSPTCARRCWRTIRADATPIKYASVTRSPESRRAQNEGRP